VSDFCFSNRCDDDDRSNPAKDNSPNFQPFLRSDDGAAIKHMGIRMAQTSGNWSDFMSPEQTAVALGQVTATKILPPLTELPTGNDLLEYSVNLRDHLDESVVRELRLLLETNWRDLGWERTTPTSYLCVIGAGAAACIDTTRNREQIYLRYASELENELYLAGRTVDLPRSRLGLQIALREKVNVLLSQVRSRAWQWISG
jgi:hypothetical protein